MKIKTSELTGVALDWAVATATGAKCTFSPYLQYPNTPKEKVVGYGVYFDPPERDEFGIVAFEPSTSWDHTGPLIERERISIKSNLCRDTKHPNYDWQADCPETGQCVSFNGPTPLIAAMRCYVYSKLGDEIDIPEELCG